MTDRIVKQPSDVKLIVFACEAGMGSSLMGANQLKKMCKKAKLDVKVIHSPLQQVPDGADIIVTHEGMAAAAKAKAPSAAIVPFKMFFNDPAVKALVDKLSAGTPIESAL